VGRGGGGGGSGCRWVGGWVECGWVGGGRLGVCGCLGASLWGRKRPVFVPSCNWAVKRVVIISAF